MKLLFTSAILFLSLISAFCQKKTTIGLETSVGIPIGKEIQKTYTRPGLVYGYVVKKYSNPYTSINLSIYHEINKAFQLGIGSGGQIFYAQDYGTGVKRTFAAVPIKGIAKFLIPVSLESKIGFKVSGGLLINKVDDYIVKINNGFLAQVQILFSREMHNIFAGFEHIREHATYYRLGPTGTDTRIKVLDDRLFRYAILVGYEWRFTKKKKK